MSQFDPVIGADKSGLAYRQDDNNGKKAIMTHHKGATAPNYAEAGITWLDDSASPWVLKIFDGSDWIVLGEVDATNNTFNPHYQGGVIQAATDSAAGLVEKSTDAEAAAGTDTARFITPKQLADNGGGIFEKKLLHIQDQKVSGTHGGAATAGSWQTRTLNTVLTNEISGASLSSNAITLPAGIYHLECSAVFYRCGLAKLKLRQTSATAQDMLIGMNTFANTDYGMTFSTGVSGRFTLGDEETIELQYQVQTTRATDGVGFACSFGVAETYADLKIWKVA